MKDLTQAFVAELNKRAEVTDAGMFANDRKDSRIFLCFDTFEAVAGQLEPWLLDTFLVEDINPNVVLLIAGRTKLSLDKNRWLPYVGSDTLHQIEMKPFSKDETRTCLADAAITDSTRIEQIWRLSGGLPLYLSMLTVTRDAKIDPTETVVENFMRWIPEDAPHKRRLVVDAALFSHPFNRDDLKAFSYIGDAEREALYRWLLHQPFVKVEEGRNRYHDVAKSHFLRYVLQRSPDDCRAARNAIAAHYQAGLVAIEMAELHDASDTESWLYLALALVSQLFLLPELEQHVRAANLVIRSLVSIKDEVRSSVIKAALLDLSNEANGELNPKARLVIRNLLTYSDNAADDEAWHAAANGIIGILRTELEHTATAAASVYLKQADRLRISGQGERALDVCESALLIRPDFAPAWNHKGFLLHGVKRREEAVASYREALRLSPDYAFAWFNLGVALFGMNEKEEALASLWSARSFVPLDELV